MDGFPLTPHEIEEALQNLEREGVIERVGDEIVLTGYGRLMAEALLRTDPLQIRLVLALAHSRVHIPEDRIIIAHVARTVLAQVDAEPPLPGYWAGELADLSELHPEVARFVGQLLLDLCVDDDIALMAGRALAAMVRESEGDDGGES